MDEIEHLRPMLKRGDAEAWRSLVRALAGPLFRYARPLSRDDDGAEEIVQQTFVRLSRARLKEQGSLRTLAFHIATNLLRDEHRNRNTRQRHEQEAAMPEAATDDPQRQAEAKEAWQSAMKLPVELREVVLLRYGQGFTAAETAAVLGIPEGTVKTRQRKALENLRGSALAAPALATLELDLQAASEAAQVPTTLAPNVEAAIMASIGTKTGINAGILALAALLLIAGTGIGIYLLSGAPSGQAGLQRPALTHEEATTAKAQQEPENKPSAPPVMAGPNAADRKHSHETGNTAATSPPQGEAPSQTGNVAESANGNDPTGTGDEEAGKEPAEQPSFRASIAGRVVDYRGEGVANASVHIEYYVANADDVLFGRTQELTKQRTIRADVHGVYSFEIESPRMGEELFASVTQHATEPDTPPVIESLSPFLRHRLRSGDERTGIRLEVQRMRFQGRVDSEAQDPENPELGSHPFRATFSGRVVDEQRLPVTGAKVQFSYLYVLPSNPRSHRAFKRGDPVETEVTGSYTLALTGSVRDESVTALVLVSVTADGLATKRRWEKVEATNGQHYGDIDFVLYVSGTAVGRVVDRDGKPVSGSVSLRPAEEGDQVVVIGVGQTDQDGRFRADRLPPGKWTLSVSTRDGYRRLREPIEFEVTPGAEILLPDAVLMPPSTVLMRLLGDDGEPLSAGTEIRLIIADDQPSSWNRTQSTTKADGYVTFKGSIKSGTREARLNVTGLDYEEHKLTLIILEGQENDIGEIRLRWARDKAE